MKDRYVLGVGYPYCPDPTILQIGIALYGGRDIVLETKAPDEVWNGDTKWRLVIERIKPVRKTK